MKQCLALLFCAMAFSACLKNSPECIYKESTLVAPATEVQAVEAYLAGKGITTATKHPSGFYYEIINPGSGNSATICSSVLVSYVGRLTNDNIFDQSHGSPVSFVLGTLIPGWQKGIPLIKKGGEIKLYIPPTLGYRDQAVVSNGVTLVPANSILIFNIQLADLH